MTSKLRAFFGHPAAAAALGGAAVGLFFWIAIAAGWIEGGGGDSGSATIGAAPLRPASDNGDGISVRELYDRTSPAVAYVRADSGAPRQTPFGFPEGGGEATGSGFLIDNDGHLLTNAHVVAGAQQIEVTLGENEKTVDAELVGADESTDVALLKVDPDGIEAKPLELGDSGSLDVGQPVIAIGNPFGLDRTVTTGIISALQREIQAPNGFTITDVVQTDASINPGNSGGPLIDASGKVIGINSQIATAGGGGSVGVGFAVPVDTARSVFEQLRGGGEVKHAFLGITGATLPGDLAERLNLPAEGGALVTDVSPDSPAERAGLSAGNGELKIEIDGQTVNGDADLIIAVDGERVTSMDEVIAAINRSEPGSKIKIEFVRDGSRETVDVTLGDRPAQAG